ncbi:hypothetical protein SARC_12837 [Sphaeroforma arctica JP610]|uniref:Uncharacterized protein n=1 Tax=Sphaeroforma arctica JP610 TaxID=667725 RepID=A0A0L0FCZ3_9EUKA|nr:hypothetical protein SARC_12837 [Sphaeroforma arctica JP610]KNC74622.1 hypothetical protein SARC_12837 [Sphaeroforma arctica JP610]|eukprot:XP_014148524.1 hypothetical protein SARC_12837 [Sphaeroforma arctica JP610]
MQLFIACCALCLAFTNGLTLNPGDNLATEIAGAFAGDSIYLTPGEYFLDEPIVVDRAIRLEGDDAVLIVPDGKSTVLAFGDIDGFDSWLEGITIKTVTGNECELADPYLEDLRYNMSVISSTITNDHLDVLASGGKWHKQRQLTDVTFNNCKYSENHPDKMIGGVHKLMGDCRSVVGYSVPVKSLSECGTTSRKVGAFTQYAARIGATYNDHINMKNPDQELRATVNRMGRANQATLIIHDKARNIMASGGGAYSEAQLTVSVSSMDSGYFDGWNRSLVTAETRVKSPYTILDGATGPVIVLSTKQDNVIVGQYTVDQQCNRLRGTECKQTLQIEITACDMSGAYSISNIPMTCQDEKEEGEVIECPILKQTGWSSDIQFSLNTHDSCTESAVITGPPFEVAYKFRSDFLFRSTRPSSVYALGEKAYWSLMTSASARPVDLFNAEIIKASRASEGNCADQFYVIPLEHLNQRFSPEASEVQVSTIITPQLACASKGGAKTSFVVSLTILFDYDIALRRRRNVNADIRPRGLLGKREVDEQTVEIELITQYTDEELEAAANTAEGDGNNTMIVMGAVAGGAILVLCCCSCCIAAVAVVVIRRKKLQAAEEKSKMDKELTNSGDLSTMSFATTVGTSTASVRPNGGSFRSQGSMTGMNMSRGNSVLGGVGGGSSMVASNFSVNSFGPSDPGSVSILRGAASMTGSPRQPRAIPGSPRISDSPQAKRKTPMVQSQTPTMQRKQGSIQGMDSFRSSSMNAGRASRQNSVK